MKNLSLLILLLFTIPSVAQDVIIKKDYGTILVKTGSIRALKDSYEYIKYKDEEERRFYINKEEVLEIKGIVQGEVVTTEPESPVLEETNEDLEEEVYLDQETPQEGKTPYTKASRLPNRGYSAPSKDKSSKGFGKYRVSTSLSGPFSNDHLSVGFEKSLVSSDWLYFRGRGSFQIPGSILFPDGLISNFLYKYNLNADLLWVVNKSSKRVRNYFCTGFSYNNLDPRRSFSSANTYDVIGFNMGYGLQIYTPIGLTPEFYVETIRHITTNDVFEFGVFITFNLGYTF